MTEECNDVEVQTTEEYTFKTGDKGFLRNGVDTYRIGFTDANFNDDFPLACLVYMHSHATDGSATYEQSMNFKANGWAVPHSMFGGLGDDSYDLMPPVES